jgi:hypothetical protein
MKAEVSLPRFAVVSILVTILLSIVRVWAYRSLHRAPSSTDDEFIAACLGTLIGFLFWPAVIAYLVKGRKGDWNGFGRWFFLLAILWGFIPMAR